VNKIICGVDVSKNELVAALEGGRSVSSFRNDAEGIGELMAFLGREDAGLCVFEATGGFERRAVLMLAQAGFGVAVVDPRRVRQFAEAVRGPEKTDAIDAAMIAAFARTKGLGPMTPPSPDQQRLTSLVRRLGQLVSDLSVQKNRLSATEDGETQASLRRVIATLKAEIKRFEGEAASLIDDDPLWGSLASAFTEVKGVAGRTVARLMADLPEIGTYSGKAIAKLVGLAPIANDSGPRQGRRVIRGGRAPVRAILFIVARTAAKYHQGLAGFYQRLKDAGKPPMVIRVALARKLIVILNAKARDARIRIDNAT
jgi:transposase